MSKTQKSLSTKSSAELLSYIINVTPELKGEIDLPVQGQSIIPIGKIILNNERYKNAFINTVNLIGLTVIKRNGWDNPWDFTIRGTLRFGQQIREIVNDLCNVYDYNSNFSDVDRFLDNVVPNVFNYMHEVNFQKFYQTTTSDAQLAMAFDSEDSLFNFIDDAIGMLYESLAYDRYIVDKYMLCKRIVDGTVTPTYIANYNSLSNRQKVSSMKNVSNKMTFRSPNYNPAGIRRATSFDDQIFIANTEFEADFSTDVMATSFFRDEADMKARMVLVDGFENHDSARLTELLGNAYVPFTSGELQELASIPGVLISREWFMDYYYNLGVEGETRTTEFFNPVNLTNNHFLSAWMCFSSSPFENATVYTSIQPTVTSVTVSPATATVSAGQTLQLSATTVTTGFANKAVYWSVDATSEGAGISIDQNGVLSIPTGTTASSTVTVTATSIFDNTVTGTATITTA